MTLPPPEPASRRSTVLLTAVAAGLLGLHAVLAWLLRTPAISTGQDDAVYLLLARGLGRLAYHNYWLVDAPAQAQYPPLYPAVLAIAQAVFGSKLDVALLLNTGLSTAALGLTFALVRPWSAPLALGALAIGAVNPALVRLAGHVTSEPLFMFCTVAALWCLTRRPELPAARVGAGVLAVAAALSRIAGVAVVIGVFVHWLLGRRFRAAAVFAVASLVVLGAWSAWVLSAPKGVAGQSYLADLLQVGSTPGKEPVAARVDTLVSPAMPPQTRSFPEAVARRVSRNFRIYLTAGLPSALALPTTSGTRTDNWAWLAVLVVFGGFGLVELARRSPGTVVLLACYSSILLIWPYPLERFVAPVAPLVVTGLLLGASRVGGSLGAPGKWVLPALLAAVMAASAIDESAARLDRIGRCDRRAPFASPACYEPDQRAFFAAVFRVAAAAPSGAVSLSPKAATLFYLTGLRSVDAYRAATLSPDRLDSYLGEKGAHYIVLSKVHADQRGLARKLAVSCNAWDLVAEYAGGTLLLRRAIPATRGGARTADSCAAIQRFIAGPW